MPVNVVWREAVASRIAGQRSDAGDAQRSAQDGGILLRLEMVEKVRRGDDVDRGLADDLTGLRVAEQGRIPAGPFAPYPVIAEEAGLLDLGHEHLRLKAQPIEE